MNARMGTWTWTGVLTALWASVAVAQVGPVQGGGVLDANPQVGASRQNALRPLDTRIDSQLYVDGKVTGLARFHGSTGYRPFDQFHGNLPSGDQSVFDAESVGLRQALSGTPYITAPYYDPSRTIAGGLPVVQGRVTPGKTVPNPPQPNQTVYDRLYTDAVREYQPLLPPEIQSIIKPESPLAPRIGILPESALTPGDQAAMAALGRIAPLGVDVLGRMSDLNASQLLSRQLYEIQAEEVRKNKPSDNRVVPTPAGAVPELAPAAAKVEPAPRESAAERPAGMPREGQDVFLDVLVLLQQQQKAPAVTAPKEPKTARTRHRLTPEEARQEIVGMTPVDMVDNQIRIHSLAGRGKDAFNEHKRRGQNLLREGKFYDAIDEFQSAVIINPDDPTGHIGLALGAFGAGEVLRSAVLLRQAMEQFPRIMEFHYDLSRWIEVRGLETSLKELNDRIVEKGGKVNPALAAMGAWVCLNVGKDQRAAELAGLLKETAPNDKLYTTLADYVRSAVNPSKSAPAAPPHGRK